MIVRPQPDCPQCHSRLLRIPRTRTDRYIDVLVPVRRYRCVLISCGWEGLLRRRDWPVARAGSTPTELPTQVLDSSLGFASGHRQPTDA